MIKGIRNEDINNIDSESNHKKNIKDIFIFAVGYEDRCVSILLNNFNDNNSIKLGFLFDDYKKYSSAIKNKELSERINVILKTMKYEDSVKILKKIIKTYNVQKKKYKKINIHIDYSSMPRSWYCNLSINICKYLDKNDRVYLWYSQGNYDSDEIEYWPNAGIEDFVVFNGRASLRPENNRSHILGLGFDSTRAHAICSYLDPSYLVLTYSHVHDDILMLNKIKKLNKALRQVSAFSVSLPVDDFQFSLSKLYETVKELHPKGDVILVPDGPKTQILAASLLPELFKEFGVICLHVKRHDSSYEAINVTATGNVYGFSYESNSFQ